IDDLGLPSQNAHVIAFDDDAVPGLEPSIFCKRAGSVEISQHRRLCLDLQHAIDDPRLASLAADAQQQRIGTETSGPECPQFGRTVLLHELRVWKHVCALS